jgi:putative aminopeptidase FrvX
VGTPVTYAPNVVELAGGRIGGTAVDDRAACAVMLELAHQARGKAGWPALHLVFSVQEEFNLRGAVTAAQVLLPDICIQLDLALATDTPDMTARGDVRLGGGPVMSLYSFHGRGTLNGCIPHPALADLFERTAAAAKIPLQRSVHTGALTETSYVQLVGRGVAAIDMGFPARYTHSALEVCDVSDLARLAELLLAAVAAIDRSFSLDRDDHIL